ALLSHAPHADKLFSTPIGAVAADLLSDEYTVKASTPLLHHRRGTPTTNWFSTSYLMAWLQLSAALTWLATEWIVDRTACPSRPTADHCSTASSFRSVRTWSFWKTSSNYPGQPTRANGLIFGL